MGGGSDENENRCFQEAGIGMCGREHKKGGIWMLTVMVTHEGRLVYGCADTGHQDVNGGGIIVGKTG